MEKRLKTPTIITYLFLVILLIYYITKGNYEFITYTVVVGFLYYIILRLDKKYNYPTYAIWLFVLWIMMHLLGGTLYFGGIKLYDLILVPIFNGGGEFIILKYDQLVHAYCYMAIGILIYYSLKKHFENKEKTALVIFAILATIGIGLLNEIIEFGMVIFAGAAEAVGGYYNTALDLVFNLIGAIIGVGAVARKD